MIDREHKLSAVRQARLPGISRGSVYYLPRPVSVTASRTSFNSDQGSQFTSIDFTAVLKKAEIAIWMDGKGAWRDNIFVERLWRSVKYEEVYLHACKTVFEARCASADI